MDALGDDVSGRKVAFEEVSISIICTGCQDVKGHTPTCGSNIEPEGHSY
jgi:hypothetical protein